VKPDDPALAAVEKSKKDIKCEVDNLQTQTLGVSKTQVNDKKHVPAPQKKVVGGFSVANLISEDDEQKKEPTGFSITNLVADCETKTEVESLQTISSTPFIISNLISPDNVENVDVQDSETPMELDDSTKTPTEEKLHHDSSSAPIWGKEELEETAPSKEISEPCSQTDIDVKHQEEIQINAKSPTDSGGLGDIPTQELVDSDAPENVTSKLLEASQEFH